MSAIDLSVGLRLSVTWPDAPERKQLDAVVDTVSGDTAELTAHEAGVWRALIRRGRLGWFDSSGHPILIAIAQSAADARAVELLETLSAEGDQEAFDRWLSVRAVRSKLHREVDRGSAGAERILALWRRKEAC